MKEKILCLYLPRLLHSCGSFMVVHLKCTSWRERAWREVFIVFLSLNLIDSTFVIYIYGALLMLLVQFCRSRSSHRKSAQYGSRPPACRFYSGPWCNCWCCQVRATHQGICCTKDPPEQYSGSKMHPATHQHYRWQVQALASNANLAPASKCRTRRACDAARHGTWASKQHGLYSPSQRHSCSLFLSREVDFYANHSVIDRPQLALRHATGLAKSPIDNSSTPS